MFDIHSFFKCLFKGEQVVAVQLCYCLALLKLVLETVLIKLVFVGHLFLVLDLVNRVQQPLVLNFSLSYLILSLLNFQFYLRYQAL